MNGGAYLIYDGECPFCSQYVKMTRLSNSIGDVLLIDARENRSQVQAAKRMGYDLDSGMLLYVDGQYFHGADCLNRLALLTTGSDLFNKVCAIAFRSGTISRIAYPVLRFGRNLTLRALRRRAWSQD